jgi:hypothetical protein
VKKASSVEDHLAQLPDDSRATLEKVRAAIRAAAPEAEEKVVIRFPIGVGTTIRRRHTHYGDPIEGTMEVVEYEPDRALGMVIHDGPVDIRTRMLFEPEDEGGTRVRGFVDIPSATSPIDRAAIQASSREMKRLIESEV